jgi:hypothetical protein
MRSLMCSGRQRLSQHQSQIFLDMDAKTLQSIVGAVNDNAKSLDQTTARYADVSMRLNRLMNDWEVAWESPVAKIRVADGRELAKAAAAVSRSLDSALSALRNLGRTATSLRTQLLAVERRLGDAHSGLATYTALLAEAVTSSPSIIADLEAGREHTRREIDNAFREAERIQEQWAYACRTCLTQISTALRDMEAAYPPPSLMERLNTAANQAVSVLATLFERMTQIEAGGYLARSTVHNFRMIVTRRELRDIAGQVAGLDDLLARQKAEVKRLSGLMSRQSISRRARRSRSTVPSQHRNAHKDAKAAVQATQRKIKEMSTRANQLKHNVKVIAKDGQIDGRPKNARNVQTQSRVTKVGQQYTRMMQSKRFLATVTKRVPILGALVGAASAGRSFAGGDTVGGATSALSALGGVMMMSGALAPIGATLVIGCLAVDVIRSERGTQAVNYVVNKTLNR